MLIAEAIGLGLVVSLLFTEAVGFAAGGFVVPGYIALYLDSPAPGARDGARRAPHLRLPQARGPVPAHLRPAHAGPRGAPRVHLRRADDADPDARTGGRSSGALAAIGYIIPGLLAYWMTRQGIVQTLAAMGVASVLVRLALIVLHGGALLETASL